MGILAASGMTSSVTDIVSVVGSVVTIATTGDLAIYFWGGVVGIGIAIMKKLKK